MSEQGLDTPAPFQVAAELHRLIGKTDEALRYLWERSEEYAVAENGYRMAKAKHFLAAHDKLKSQFGRKPTVDECSAWVDLHTELERVSAHSADAMVLAARLALKARIAQLSAAQSIANVLKGEMELDGRREAA